LFPFAAATTQTRRRKQTNQQDVHNQNTQNQNDTETISLSHEGLTFDSPRKNSIFLSKVSRHKKAFIGQCVLPIQWQLNSSQPTIGIFKFGSEKKIF
jgi:hypothetical protein